MPQISERCLFVAFLYVILGENYKYPRKKLYLCGITEKEEDEEVIVAPAEFGGVFP